ncbi:MAG TPA: GNAT family N-acetyltransferase [Sphingomicrobium sp.]|nr:GNAT family N-acetyltransferase [Sphingomicrobium sp.]
MPSTEVPTSSDDAVAVRLVEQPAAERRGALLAQLVRFNAGQAPAAGARPLCVAISNATDDLDGGLWGVTLYDWLAIELLFVPDGLRGRGLGAAILALAEQEARTRGCIGAWLDTFSFQARGFYERLGYVVAGSIPDHPRGGARFFLMKRWA